MQDVPVGQKIVIKSQEGYEQVKARVEKGGKILEGHWGDPKYSKWVRMFDMLASAMWVWEFDNGIFDREFAKFERKLAIEANQRKLRSNLRQSENLPLDNS